MKQLILVLLSTMTLAACSSGGDSKGNSGGGNGKMPAPTSYTGTRTLFTNKWKIDYSEGTAIFEFTPSSTKVSNYCKNGKVASVSVRARNTSTHLQALEDKTGGDSSCHVAVEATVATTYSISGDVLITSEGAAEAY